MPAVLMKRQDGLMSCLNCANSNKQPPTPQEIRDRSIHKLRLDLERLPTATKMDMPRIIWQCWEHIKPKRITVDVGSKENYYTLELEYGKIQLTEDDCLKSDGFRKQFHRIYGVMLPSLPGPKWAAILSEWEKERSESETEAVSLERDIVDEVINYISTSTLINLGEELQSIDKAAAGVVYLSKGKILVTGETIRKVVSRVDRYLKSRNVSGILRSEGLLFGTSTTHRIGNEFVRMWAFDPIKVGVDVGKVITLVEDVGGQGV
jgi:hypothetical protein